MRGPTSVLASSPGPRRSRSARSHTILSSLSCTRSCTTRRLVAVQPLPAPPLVPPPPPRAGPALAGRPARSPQRAFEGEVQVRALLVEHRVLAALRERETLVQPPARRAEHQSRRRAVGSVRHDRPAL